MTTMKTDLSSKSILVQDNGLFLNFALRMAEPGGFGKVYYVNNWRRGRPSFNEIAVGKGYDGIEVLKHEWDVMDKVDVIAFPDVLDGDRQVYLRRHGYKVWGSGKGEELELYRVFWKKMVAAMGLPVNDYKVIKGISNLRRFLEENEDKFIKISFMRGLWESRQHEKYWISKTHIDRLEYQLGPLAETTEFLVEEPVETKLEVAADGMFVTNSEGIGRFLSLSLNGVEIKDSGYVGVVQRTEDMAGPFQMVSDALQPVLQRYGYANLFACESRIDGDDQPYPIDPCCRVASPAGEAQLATWDNLPEIVYHGAHGQIVDPVARAPYVAQAMIFNKGDENEWCAVDVPSEVRDKVKLYYGMRRGKEDWIVPQMNPFDEIGSVVDIGQTAEEAIKKVTAIAKKLGGDISIKIEALADAAKAFDLMEQRGMSTEPAENLDGRANSGRVTA